VGLCQSCEQAALPPEIRFIAIPRTSTAFEPDAGERAVLINTAKKMKEEISPDAMLLWMGPDLEFVRVLGGKRMVVDLVDCSTVYSWLALRGSRGLRGWLRQLRELLWYIRAERQVGREASSVVAVGELDASVLRKLIGRNNVYVVPNGVCVTESALTSGRDPSPVVVFTGVMGYPPNVEAVLWFSRKVWPLIRRAVPEARFLIAGRNPVPEIECLVETPGIEVLGSVPDMAEILRRAWVSVAPMRSGTGIKNKVLEAWAVGTPVVMTPLAANGLGEADAIRAMVGADPEAFADLVVSLLKDSDCREKVGMEALELARERSWSTVAANLSSLLTQVST
jgi:glycosyltransferase involved in cell wall biosynthesis